MSYGLGHATLSHCPEDMEGPHGFKLECHKKSSKDSHSLAIGKRSLSLQLPGINLSFLNDAGPMIHLTPSLLLLPLNLQGPEIQAAAPLGCGEPFRFSFFRIKSCNAIKSQLASSYHTLPDSHSSKELLACEDECIGRVIASTRRS